MDGTSAWLAIGLIATITVVVIHSMSATGGR
jgi:hypothetical protein